MDYKRDSFDSQSDYVTLDLSTDNGSTWTEVTRFAGPADDNGHLQAASYDISAFVGQTVILRFLTSDDLGSGDKLYIDNLEIAYTTGNGNGNLPTSSSIDVRINDADDDVEEELSDGDMSLGSSDMEIGDDPSSTGGQVVGLRFNGLQIPPGATISNAYIEFETDETDSIATSVSIMGQLVDNAPAFSSADYNLSSRAQTNDTVAWNNIAAWSTISEKHQTPNLAAIVQELVNQSGWTAGNSMVFIIDGNGTRTAEAYDGESANAPLLHVEFSDIPNLLQDPSFENGMADWSLYGSVNTTTDSHSGNGAVEIAPGGKMEVYPSVIPGEAYTFSLFADKQGSAGWSGMGIAFYDPLGNILGIESTAEISSTVYQQVSLSATAPTGTTHAVVWYEPIKPAVQYELMTSALKGQPLPPTNTFKSLGQSKYSIKALMALA